MSWQDALTPRRLQWALLVAPLALTTLYLGLFAADRYVSESVMTVRQASPSGSVVPGAALLFVGVTPLSREDVLYLRRYVHSAELLNRLEQRLQLRRHYGQPERDLAYRLAAHATREEFVDYYRERVEVLLDDVSGLMTVRTQGFDPTFAQQLNAAILEESEAFVNALSQRAGSVQLRFAENELSGAADKLQAAKQKVLAFQARHRVIDASAQAQATATLVGELQAQLSKQEAELRHLSSYLDASAHPVQALRRQAQSLRTQLQLERGRATTTAAPGRQTSALAAEFEDLGLQVAFAQDVYKLALGAVENSRIEATRKLKTLAVIEPPTAAQTAEYPRRLYILASQLVLGALFYGVVRLVLATIAEHQD